MLGHFAKECTRKGVRVRIPCLPPNTMEITSLISLIAMTLVFVLSAWIGALKHKIMTLEKDAAYLRDGIESERNEVIIEM